jgi:3-hexulose-6-phosphate synthase/6-phospho-3-hexuloisomerase
VIVIEAGGVGPAVWGELATNSCLQRKVAGVVIDGGIRDSGEIRALEFPAFARHIMPHAGEPRGLGEIGVAIRIGGVDIRPGDWLLGDDDGVVVVARERAVEYANRAQDVLERENRVREEITRGSTLASVAQLMKWEKVG